MTLPPPLRKGDTIGVMAPSHRVNKARISQAVELLKNYGYNVYIHPQTWKEDGCSAGTAKQKAKALNDLFADPEIGGIICARGGNRAGSMLPHMDFRIIKKNPKIVIGFSDITALLNSIYKETDISTFHGPNLQTTVSLSARQMKQCLALLGGEETAIPMGGARILHPGRVKGPLAGGNLSLISSLMGTRWQPDFKGKILFLEDCCDELSRYDRMLRQLANAGAFAQAAGVIFGGFSVKKETGALPFGFTLEDVFREVIAGTKIPAVMNAPFGHGRDLYTFPVGGTARLNAAKGKISLELAAACAKT